MQSQLSKVIIKGFRWSGTPEYKSNNDYWPKMHEYFETLESKEQESHANKLADIILGKNPNLNLNTNYHNQDRETSNSVYKSCKIICIYLERFGTLPSVDLLKELNNV